MLATIALYPAIEQVFYSGGISNVRVRHVWVDVTGAWSSPDPGILLEWRHERTVHGMRWQGLVIYANTHSLGGGLGWAVRQGWMDAAHIRSERNGLEIPMQG